jgi:hypothetical protein
MLLRFALVVTLLAAAPLEAAVPTPESHFGHKIGADRTVLDWDRVVSYFRALEKNSDRIQVTELGKSTEGRPFIAAIIAAPSTLRRLDRYNWIQKKLADPRPTPEAEADKLIAEGKAVVLITCSIHATEIASTHAAVELAYRLLTEDKGKSRAILDNTILLLVPSLNPDGVDIVTRWYRKTLGTPYEGSGPPELYQKYVGHDNNRDWYMFTQAETRLTVSKLHNVWHPRIVYDLHQMGPSGARIFVPPWMDPIDPNIDPILVQEVNMIGTGMAADLTGAGKSGVLINAMYDFWTPGRHYQAYHGGLRILSEAASVRIASPLKGPVEPTGREAAGPREMSWNYLEPWTGGEWKLRDIIDYELVALESCLYQAAIRREDLLRNFYHIGRRAVERRSPYAFLLSSTQRDPGATQKLLETLAFGLVEIDRAGAGFEAGGKKYPGGSYVIRMQQPYSGFAKTLLERQKYPDLRQYPGGPPRRPYDVTAHTLPLLMGVEVETVDAPLTAALKRVNEFRVELNVRRPPSGGLPASDTDSWRAVNRIWKSGRTVWRDAGAGDFYSERSESQNLKELKRPRIGLYKSFMGSMDEGWTRWILEQFEFAYKSVGNHEIQAGALRKDFDVLVFPDQAAFMIANGYRPGSMPEEFTGGLGEKGAESLKQFASEGGTLVFLNHAAEYATEQLGVNVKNVVRGVSSRDFYSPGSLLNVTLDARSPLSYGLPAQITIWSEGSPAWEIPEGSTARSVAQYPASQILASGWLLGEKHLAGRSALVECPMGTGRVILFGMRPQYRAQSYQTFKLLFNSLLPAM